MQEDVHCDGCPGGSVSWDEPNLPLTGLYVVEAVAFDRVGNASRADTMTLLIF